MQTASENERPELVFALVGPAGVRLRGVSKVLKEHLHTFGYKTIDIRISDLLKNFKDCTEAASPGEYERIIHRQKMALKVRKNLNDGAALVRAGILAIREERTKITGSPDQPAFSHVYVLDQLKHPSEVDLLRQIYGSSFILIAGHAPKIVRLEVLAKQMADSDVHSVNAEYQQKAEAIIDIDDKQDDENDLGQNTRDTYPLADFFANLGRDGGENSVRRFVDLLFGHPFITPYPEEYAMYQAAAGSLRSSDENRQVGAVIAKLELNSGRILNVDVVASGMNEVPRRGGGFYWHEDSPDGRDQWLIAYNEDDRAKKIKTIALAELLEKIKKIGWLNASVNTSQTNFLARELLPHLKGTQFMNIGEFVRPVHAEMAALIDSARRGVAVHGLSMYVTTFPCHNCAKHIIAAGLKQVIYLEPYPKSKAKVLHGEEIELDSTDGSSKDNKVVFMAFTGVAPRQYQCVFSMSSRGAKKGLSLRQWETEKATLSPRYVLRNASAAYLLAERQELDRLPNDIYKYN